MNSEPAYWENYMSRPVRIIPSPTAMIAYHAWWRSILSYVLFGFGRGPATPAFIAICSGAFWFGIAANTCEIPSTLETMPMEE